MGTFLGSLLGCFFALIVHDLIENWSSPKPIEPKTSKPIIREIPKNIGRFKDPLEAYEKYKENGLYRPIKQKAVNRIEIGSDNDSN